MCEDRKCSFSGPCWIDAENTAHINLTHMHLRTWAAAIIRFAVLSIYTFTDFIWQDAGRDGVDDQHPPNGKLFDPKTVNSNADITAMARRRAANSGAANAGSSNVYVSFDGLAELLRGGPVSVPPQVGPVAPLAAPFAPANLQERPLNDVSKWPKIDLATFCERFDIPDQLQAKLAALCVQGPHALGWIKDEDLRGEGGLMLGELGTLRDAEQRWKRYNSWDT